MGSILEPACGDGAISKVLLNYYPKSEIISYDLIDRGYGIGNTDFLTYNYGRKFDNVITNPPYRYATEFVKKSLKVSDNKVAMLLKIQFLEGIKRFELFKNSPLEKVYVFSQRLKINKNGEEQKNSTMFCFAWFVWNQLYKGEPQIDWIC
jgi:hypothetical protein